MMSESAPKIYSATYSNVPVYEFNVSAGNHVMRRRADDWINATHILKVAAYDKPARTRILEREVQKGVHEKVQGGYGKYQGTWIPLHDGRSLAERNNVLEKLLPIFDFVPGDRSPPPAPKHATAASSRPRAPRQNNNAPKRQSALQQPQRQQLPQIQEHQQKHYLPEESYDAASMSHYADEDAGDNMTIVSESLMDDDHYNPQYTNPRKRRRADQMPVQDQQHQIWADALLDYFMLLESEDPFPAPPEPPHGINIDKPIDDKGHTALHWAAAMGDIDVVKDLISRHARIESASNNLETPLMRAVLFTNNYDKQSMAKLVRILAPTVMRTDWFGSTVFHHIAATTSSKNKYLSARYYLDTIIGVLSETWIADEVTRLLNMQDQNGDTAIMIAARNGARKCVRSLLGRNVAVDNPNHAGETADDLIRELNARRQRHMANGGRGRDVSSSPFAPDGVALNGDGVGLPSSQGAAAVVGPQYRSQTATTLMSRIAPSLMERCRSLATAFETEWEEKVQEALEAERVLKKRTLELESLKRQVQEMEAAGLDKEADDPALRAEDEAEEEELRMLIEEAEALLELESRDELRTLMANTPGSATPSFHSDHQMGNNAGMVNGYSSSFPQHSTYGQVNGTGNNMPTAPMLPSQDPNSASALAVRLTQAQRERQRLVRETVQAMSVAGLGERQAEYKRLILAALGARSPSASQSQQLQQNNSQSQSTSQPHSQGLLGQAHGSGLGHFAGVELDLEREGMLDEILRELEEERRIAIAEGPSQGAEDGVMDADDVAGASLVDPGLAAAASSLGFGEVGAIGV